MYLLKKSTYKWTCEVQGSTVLRRRVRKKTFPEANRGMRK